MTLFQLAAWVGNAPLVDLFCQHRARINKPDLENAIKLTVDNFCPFWSKFPDMTRPTTDVLQVIKTLLKHGAVSKDNRALYHAPQLGNPDIVRLICNNGADVNNYVVFIEDTPLHMAWMYNVEVVHVLCEFGADVNKGNKQGDIPLHCAVQNSRFEPFTKSRASLKLLCEFGSDVNMDNKARRTPIGLAARHSQIQDICRAYQVVHPNQGCVTPLHTAVHTGNAQMVRELCNVHSTDVNAEDGTGRTPLFTCCTERRSRHN